MKVKIYNSKVKGEIKAPASKSILHRALICGALASGETTINNVSYSDDIISTINALKSLGAKIIKNKNTIVVSGIKKDKKLEKVELDAKESGSTLRFLIPLAPFFAKEVVFRGSDKLLSRPLNIYKNLYKKENLKFIKDKNKLIVSGVLNADNYLIKGDVSSQFITGLLFLLPLLKEDSTIKVLKPFESKSYVNLTKDMLNNFKVNVLNKDNNYIIKANQQYKAANINVESDFSQVSFFAVLAAINNDLLLKDLNLNSKQGDLKIFDFLEKANVKVEKYNNDVKVFKSKVKTATLDLKDNPDLGPVLAILGLFSDDYIKLTNVKRLRLKESDRLEAMKKQIEKIGGRVEVKENSMTVYKLEHHLDKVVEVEGCNDHRIVMAMSILATTLNKPLIINGSEAINKSYPNFFKDLKSLGVKLEIL